jgi:muconolactone delta-isomerase
MKVFAIAHRSEDHTPEDFAPLLGPESEAALKLFAEEKVREIYSRSDGKGALLVLEADDEEHARKILDELPMVEANMITVDIYGTKPYRGFVS